MLEHIKENIALMAFSIIAVGGGLVGFTDADSSVFLYCLAGALIGIVITYLFKHV